MRKEEFFLDVRLVKTRRSLEHALLSLMDVKSFEDITITDIVKEAGINRSSFYNHFSSKQELIESIINDKHKDLVYTYREPFLRNWPFVMSSLPHTEVKLFSAVFKESNYYKVLLKSDVSHLVQDKMLASFTKINKEELRVNNSKIDSDLIASYMSYAIVGLIVQWVNSNYKHSPEEMNRQLVELMRIAPNQTFNTMPKRENISKHHH